MVNLGVPHVSACRSTSIADAFSTDANKPITMAFFGEFLGITTRGRDLRLR